ncbi:ATP-dependent nuclease [Lysinibacillus fusiformis]|uniref:ATP-dependent nuclease n=1 Tax=Lysinibacillus fusiformis TaxID=28031 RepID=UPI0012457602|nr:AAA family ATPase [Lysinibacillus fusiformis]KAB0443983.1 ATP-dependent endonuclease [Lysinibacillus fusiformis]
MFLKSISLTNFRQFGIKDNGDPAITVVFNPSFNILVGENDAGKTAIIDSIRYLLGSVSDEFDKITQDDFHCFSKDLYCDYFYIEGIFANLSDLEAGTFLEWLSFDDQNNYELRVSLRVEKKKNENGQEFIDRKIQAGHKSYESRLDNQAKNLLKTTYLKPLRDASNELKPGFRSRLAQILKAHPAFKNSADGSTHLLVEAMEEANQKIEGYFKEEYTDGHSLVQDLESLLSGFYDSNDQSKSKSRFSVSRTDLASILRKLSLDTENINLGLGNLNLLFIATELLLMKNNSEDKIIIGPQITLIEEIEAHLHTQAQIRLIKYLEEELEDANNENQFILTSHSPNLVASVDPKNIILIDSKIAYPLSEEYTELEESDYAFLERFLDSTKSNLFFAKGIIFVEGDSEMLFLPALAKLIGYPLHKYGVSLVNVRGTSFERYIKLFSRSELWLTDMKSPPINIPISIITDVDIKPKIYYTSENIVKPVYSIKNIEELEQVLIYCEENTEDIVADQIGIEYSSLKSLAKDFCLTYFEQNIEHINQIVKKEITPEYILTNSQEKISLLQNKYSKYNANLKVHISPEWTLEYCLSKSVLAPLLLEAIHEVRYKNPYTGIKKRLFDEQMAELANASEIVAYKIFKPVNDKLVSKAEVAQGLAIKINQIMKDRTKGEELKQKVLADNNLLYLVDAIIHAAVATDILEGIKI